MDGVTTRSKTRKAKREKKKAKEPADISQVLGMTPTKGNKETLASATALQRARAAAQRKDREDAIADAQTKSAWTRRNKPRNSDAYLGSPHDSQIDWTVEDGYVSIDADEFAEENPPANTGGSTQVTPPTAFLPSSPSTKLP